MILEVRNLNSGYGKSLICSNINLTVEEGERVCILGRNGVGKTTLLKSILGLLPVNVGHCIFFDVDITLLKPYEIAKLGISYVPQGRGIFGKLSVYDNLRLGTVAENNRIKDIDNSIFEYFPILKERLKQKAGTLSGGEQQMLSIARALASHPRLLLLDEPSEGIQPNIIDNLRVIIKKISFERSLAILLVEQNLDFALDITERGYVIEKGSIVETGNVETLRNDKIVQQYLEV